MVKALVGEFDCMPAVPLIDIHLGQAVHTHVPLSSSSITWYQRRGSDVLRLGRRPIGHASQTEVVYLYLQSQGLSKVDDHPNNTLNGV